MVVVGVKCAQKGYLRLIVIVGNLVSSPCSKHEAAKTALSRYLLCLVLLLMVILEFSISKISRSNSRMPRC